MIRVAILTGSTRPGRLNEAVAKWVYELAQRRSDAEVELVDANHQVFPGQSKTVTFTVPGRAK